MKEVKKIEPISCLRPPIFMIGRDQRGNWVVQDPSGTRGGLFIDRAQALKYARSENGSWPYAVVMVSGVLELAVGSRAGTAPPGRLADSAHPGRRVA